MTPAPAATVTLLNLSAEFATEPSEGMRRQAAVGFDGGTRRRPTFGQGGARQRTAVVQPTRGARPQGAPPTAQPSLHANRSRRADVDGGLNPRLFGGGSILAGDRPPHDATRATRARLAHPQSAPQRCPPMGPRPTGILSWTLPRARNYRRLGP